MDAQFKITVKGLFFFELKSLIGRIFYQKKPKLVGKIHYLNLGCGNNIIKGYTNADFFVFRPLFKRHRLLEWQLDFRYRFKCDDNIFDGVFCEHTLEHLYLDDAIHFLGEIYRILKPGCLLRLTVPDLGKYVDFYTGNTLDIDLLKFRHKFASGCQAIRNLTQNYFHFTVWDFFELQNTLSDIGFQSITKKSFQKGSNLKLLLDSEDRVYETLYIEAYKPLA